MIASAQTLQEAVILAQLNGLRELARVTNDYERRITDLTTAYERQITELRSDLQQKALEVSRIETERRLEALNGEAGRLATVLAASVPQGVWDESQKSLAEWKDQVNKALAIGQGRDRGVSLAWGVGIAVVGIVIAVVSVALAVLL